MSVGHGEGYDGGDRLPWLETVDEDYEERPRGGRVFLYIFLALLLAGLALLGYYLVGRFQGQSGNGELIKAPAGDYKTRPDEPGGMKVEGQGDAAFATSQGAASNASINVAALPEAPVEGRIAPRAPAHVDPGSRTAKIAVPGTTTRAATPAPRRTVAVPALGGGSGSLVQLGAFPNEAGANIAWVRLSRRFAYLAPLGKSVERAQVEDKSVFRLRVNAGSNGQAREICGKLKVAGENCFVTN